MAQRQNTIERNHPGFDIDPNTETTTPADSRPLIEVKGRIAGADTVTVAATTATSLNEPDKWVSPSSKFTQDKAKKSATSTARSKHTETASTSP